MADEPQVIDRHEPKEIIAPGYTFGTVTDQMQYAFISDPPQD